MNPTRGRHILFQYFILLILLWGIGGCAVSHDYIARGHQYAAEGNWDKCVLIYQEGLAQHPDDHALIIALEKAKWEASLSHMESGINLMGQKFYAEAIDAFETSISFYPANQKAAFLMKEAKTKKESILYLQKGLNFKKTQAFQTAREAFKRALDLDPENEDARRELAHYIDKSLQPTGKYNLDLDFDSPVSFKFKQTSIINVFEVLTKLTGANFIFDKEMKDNKVTMFMTDMPLDRFIDILLKTNDLAAVLIDKKTLLIYPNTPAKAEEYESLQIRTFYLSNLQAKEAVALLSKILNNDDIIANENINSIVLRGTADVIEIASRILEANDGTPAEVLFNVEFLEVSRNNVEQLGLEYPESLTFGIGETNLAIDNDASFAMRASMYALSHLSKSEWMMTLPTVTLNMLKRDTDTRILSKPSVRVKNAEKAFIHIGDRVPIRVNRRVDSSTGDVTSDYQYQDVGIKVETRPIINIHDEITLSLNLEVSVLGANLGTADDPQYAIKTRTANTVLSIEAGETVIIGGLISDDDSKTLQKIPGLGEIPGLGYLFTNRNEELQDRDMLMVITPIVIRSHELPRKEAMQIWSGNAQNFSIEVPFTGNPENETVYSDEPVEEIIQEALEMNREPPLEDEPAKEQQPQPADPENPAQENPAAQTDSGRNAATADTPTRSSETWPASARYSIHVNSYPDRDEAENRLTELKRKGYDCFLIPAQVAGKGFFHRIFVGKFSGYAEAVSVCDQMKNEREFAWDIHVVDKTWAQGS